MPHFQFRLERVLAWRRNQCRIEENGLAECLNMVRATERRIEQLRLERRLIDREVLQRTSISGADLLTWERYHLGAQRDERRLAADLQERSRAAVELRQRVLEAQRRVKLLEKLREQQLEEYNRFVTQEVEKTASESYVSRWSQLRHY